ncbi:MAG: NrdJb [Immundisolibacter sp.]|uniref:TSCPD domain-containing protein n=1 Tax=Immundisolibacter sp. TaxID=1934948 RepID=UPI003D0F8D50
MTIRISNKITGFSVVRPEDATPADVARPAEPPAASEREKAKVIQMHEKLERPDTLRGTTYKIKTPLTEHALYVTINDIVLNPGTEHEHYRPFEIFINSKNMEHFQWIVALTRIVSAVFRKGGDITFLVEELKAVFDPRGGYFKKGGRYMPSLVAEIGDVIEQHLRYIGMLPDRELDARQLKLIEEKRSEFEARTGQSSPESDATYPDGAQLCYKCSTKAMILMDGCLTCLNCGESKCG